MPPGPSADERVAAPMNDDSDSAPAPLSEQFLGSSPTMRALHERIARVAPTDSTVLLLGETGTGKDICARVIHELSRRSVGPFVAVNCAAINPALVESELFGHESGSFTGAERRRKGLFEQAHRGTLLLDEITEMSTELQVKLLRVLESQRVQRVGGEKTTELDVRLIAATNRSPEDAVTEGELRQDLFYRLSVFPVELPPLRERMGDIELLANRFLEDLNAKALKHKVLDPSAIEVLDGHHWPGNVRELRHVVERAYILAEERITEAHVELDDVTDELDSDSEEVSIPLGSSIADAERALILATLDKLEGDKKTAARVLGISLKTLYNRLNRYAAADAT